MAGRLIVVSGLPGTGKSSVARLLAERLGAVQLSIDAAEEAILACGLPSGWQVGVAAYETVGAMASMNLRLGATVIVDAVNDSRPARETWHRAAAETGSIVSWFQLVCSDREEHRQRLVGRDRGLVHVGEPTWGEVTERAQSYENWREPCTVLDTAHRSLDDLIEVVVTVMGG